MRTSRRLRSRDDGRRPRTALAVLVLVAVALIGLDLTGRGAPLRSAGSAVLGPVETAAAAVVRPLTAVPDYLSSRHRLGERSDALAAENARLRAEAATLPLDRARLADYDRLARFTTTAGLRTVSAHVVGVGAAQSFGRTVTIDAGTSNGVRRDLTVLCADGLVGRVLTATRDNATVLLLVDRASVVGARLGTDGELGLLRGDGSLSGAGRMTLTAMDPTAVPAPGDAVVSWGSRNGVPYIAGVPIGRVEQVTSTPRQQTATVTVAPFVDFSALDLVTVVVGAQR